jgi:hypothetical protein
VVIPFVGEVLMLLEYALAMGVSGGCIGHCGDGGDEVDAPGDKGTVAQEGRRWGWAGYRGEM